MGDHKSAGEYQSNFTVIDVVIHSINLLISICLSLSTLDPHLISSTPPLPAELFKQIEGGLKDMSDKEKKVSIHSHQPHPNFWDGLPPASPLSFKSEIQSIILHLLTANHSFFLPWHWSWSSTGHHQEGKFQRRSNRDHFGTGGSDGTRVFHLCERWAARSAAIDEVQYR